MTEAADAAGVAIQAGSRPVLLKWHMLRRRHGEPPFSLRNLHDGVALGASVEIDIQLLGDGNWICLHDDVLDEETDGSGPVKAIGAAEAQRLRIAGADYAPPLLSDVVRIVAQHARGGTCVQIDLKESAVALDQTAIDNFAALVAPVAAHCLLSGTDWAAVAALGDAVPAMPLGFDPYDMAENRRFRDAADIEAFMQEVRAVSGKVRTFYLWHQFVSDALALGADPVGLLKKHGSFVDVWTLDPATPDIEALLPAMVDAGADQITTNDAVGMAALWERLR